MLHKGVEKGTNGVLLGFRMFDDFFDEDLVAESNGSAHSVFEDGRSEAVGEIILSGGDVAFQLEEVGEGSSLVKAATGVDLPGFPFSLGTDKAVFGSPQTDGIKVFHAESDGINLAMTAGALRHFLMSEKAFAGGEDLIGKAGEIGNIGRCRRRWLIEEFAEYPDPAFDRAGFIAVSTHEMNRSHAEESAARGVRRKFDGTEMISLDGRQPVVSGEEIVDDHIVG